MYSLNCPNTGLKYCLSLLMACCLVLCPGKDVYSQQFTPKALERHLQAMLSSDNPDTIRPVLSSDFSVGPFNLPSAMGCLRSIVKGTKYDKVRVKWPKSSDDRSTLRVRFSSKGKKDVHGQVKLDDSGKIVFIDVFDKLYGMDRGGHSTLMAEVPFETDEQGSVILDVRLNDSQRVLRLLFDSGADGMALSASLADSLGLKADVKQSASVVGGHMDIEISRNNRVHIGKLKLPHQSIAFFKHIDKYDGIIGNTILRSYITKVNYDKQIISFYSFGDFNLNDHWNNPSFIVDVTMPSGLIIVPGKIAVTKGKAYAGRFVFDLGAAYSLICFRPFVRHNRLLVDGFKPAYSGSTTSLGMTTPTFTGAAEMFQFGDIPAIKDLSVTLMSGGGQSESWNPGFDGSIGTRLISRYNFIINMQDKYISLSPNKSFDYPADFSRSNMLFGFDVEGELHFQNYVGVQPPAGGVLKGARILSIDGIATEDLRTDPQRLAGLLSKEAAGKWTIKYIEHGEVRTKDI